MHRIVCLLVFALPSYVPAQELKGVITEVHDGNTLKFRDNENEAYLVVLMGIDCPELDQSFGAAAKEFTAAALLNRRAVLQLHGKDRYSNYIGVIITEDGSDIRLALLKAGLAWTSEKNPSRELEVLRQESEGMRKGLWSEPSAVPPWIFRRQQTMTRPKSR